ncbi:MAG: heparan-alpha-glucosaminide N-acetyltransferase domain-containing protein, partial [Pseudonocardiaceae bacterium]
TDMVSVILPHYAVLFLLAIPLVFLPTRALVMVGLAAAVAVPVVSHVIRDYLPDPLPGNPSFGYLFDDPGRLLIGLLLTGIYPVLPWMAYLCTGLVIGRLRLSSARVAARLFGAGLVLAVTAAAAAWVLLGPLGGMAQIKAGAVQDGMSAAEVSDLLTFGPDGTTPTSTWWWLAVDSPHSTTPLDLLHTIGTSVALLGALLLLSTHVAQPVLRKLIAAGLMPFAAVGSMTLTLYTTHVLFLSSPLDVHDPPIDYALQVVMAMLFALIWRTTMKRGPLEALVAWLAQRARGEKPTPLSRSGAAPPYQS